MEFLTFRRRRLSRQAVNADAYYPLTEHNKTISFLDHYFWSPIPLPSY
jgi:hypothetical protein